MSKKKKYKRRNNIYVAAIVIIIILSTIFVLQQRKVKELKTKTIELQNKSSELQKELNIAEGAVELLSCPMCNGNPNMLPVNESFYAECEDCKLRTTFFDSKSELVDYWNTRVY